MEDIFFGHLLSPIFQSILHITISSLCRGVFLTSVWSVQHPSAGQIIHHLSIHFLIYLVHFNNDFSIKIFRPYGNFRPYGSVKVSIFLAIWFLICSAFWGVYKTFKRHLTFIFRFFKRRLFLGDLLGLNFLSEFLKKVPNLFLGF